MHSRSYLAKIAKHALETATECDETNCIDVMPKTPTSSALSPYLLKLAYKSISNSLAFLFYLMVPCVAAVFNTVQMNAKPCSRRLKTNSVPRELHIAPPKMRHLLPKKPFQTMWGFLEVKDSYMESPCCKLTEFYWVEGLDSSTSETEKSMEMHRLHVVHFT